MTAEQQRLDDAHARRANWQRWGPYLAERQWGTVREDYSENGDAWRYFPHEQAPARAYRWGEDGLLGICDRQCRLCFALALWNGKDPLLKERLFGLSGPEGNHGEDVKECYYYLDATPTYSYMKGLYKYPQAAYPYAQLVGENRRRGKDQPEFELADTGVFDESRYFDVQVEYAKAAPNDLAVRITAANRGPEAARIDVLPLLWFRNTWSWGCKHEGCWTKPSIRAEGEARALARHVTLGAFTFEAGPGPDGTAPKLLFTENETNNEAIFGSPNAGPYTRDAFHRYVIHGEEDAVNPEGAGTRMAAHYRLEIEGGGEAVLLLTLSEAPSPAPEVRERFDPGALARLFEVRQQEADAFHALPRAHQAAEGECAVYRQAMAGLLWTKQFYHYVVSDWLEGDPDQPTPPESRRRGRNTDWPHLFCRDILSMPDKWEYPWFAAWDTAFHMIPMALVDPQFAKDQMLLFLREWYMHPNGSIPAYEWDFGDVNPPVHAWACWRIYKMTAPAGQRDRDFLKRAFHKLLMNFTWWVNRKDPAGKNIFTGGFLGLDNIGVFDRSQPLPMGGRIEQADATAWIAFYCGAMLSMALELAREDPSYEDVASKFFEHFVSIADAINHLGGAGLWDEADGFYYDRMLLDGETLPMRVRSLVGLMPLVAVEVLEDDLLQRLPGFRKRMEWFLENRRDLEQTITYMEKANTEGHPHEHRLLAIPSLPRLKRLLHYLSDEEEFLSPFGIRSMSRHHLEHPYTFRMPNGEAHTVRYTPAESDTYLFGGNSNWRGPVWFPINFLLIEALEKYHHFHGDALRVEYPRGSGRQRNLQEIADDLTGRLTKLFLPDAGGRRPCHGEDGRYAHDPYWKNLVLFHEYFDGDNGRGVGASHQTGWTALVANALCQYARARQGLAPGGQE